MKFRAIRISKIQWLVLIKSEKQKGKIEETKEKAKKNKLLTCFNIVTLFESKKMKFLFQICFVLKYLP